MQKPEINADAIFVHVPYRFLHRHLELLLAERLQPEFFFSTEDLANLNPDDARHTAEKLAAAGLGCTFHAPFMDLNPGAVDERVRLQTVDHCRELLAAAAIYRPRSAVFHPGYDKWRYHHGFETWVSQSVLTWRAVLAQAEECCPHTRVLIENIFETDPLGLGRLFEAVDDDRLGFCFDTGHFLIFSRVRLEQWMHTLGDRLVELHLHDNSGAGDDHLPPGTGAFPFGALFAILGTPRLAGLSLTFEAHSRNDLFASLAWAHREFTIVERRPS